MSKKPWAGRFRKKTHPLFEAFSASIAFDCRLAEYDLLGSIVHAEALFRAKLLTRTEALAIKRALAEMLTEWREGRFRLNPGLEDIHMNVERRLTRKLGPLGGKLHTGRSRNDQVALDLRLYFRDETRLAIQNLEALARVLLELPERQEKAILTGYPSSPNPTKNCNIFPLYEGMLHLYFEPAKGSPSVLRGNLAPWPRRRGGRSPLKGPTVRPPPPDN